MSKCFVYPYVRVIKLVHFFVQSLNWSSYHVACDYLAYDYHSGKAREATSLAVFFDNQVYNREIQPKHLCPTCEANNISCSAPSYTIIKEILFGPESGHGTLTFEISQDAVDIPSFPLLVDIIYLEGQGYDGPPYNPPLA